MESERRVAGVSNYYVGKRAVTGVPHFERVRVRQTSPGLDVVFYGQSNQLEYDLLFSAGANPAGLRLQFKGGDAPVVSPSGDLIVRSGSTEFRQHKPNAWQDTASGRRTVECSYAATSSGDVRLV